MNKHKSKKAEQAERRRKVWTMYCRHMTQQQIADALGIVISTVCKDLKVLHAEWQKEMMASIDEVRQRELKELDDLERYATANMLESKSLKWLDRRIKVKEQRAKLLGLHTSNVNISADKPIALGWATPEEMQQAAQGEKDNGTAHTNDD